MENEGEIFVDGKENNNVSFNQSTTVSVTPSSIITDNNLLLKKQPTTTVTTTSSISPTSILSTSFSSNSTLGVAVGVGGSGETTTTTNNNKLQLKIDQLEREARESTMQIKIKDEKIKSFRNRNQFLEDSMKRLEASNENYEKELTKAKQDVCNLTTEKENLSIEIRKLTRSQNTMSESQSLWGQMTAASRELCRAEDKIQSLNRELLELKEVNASLTRQLEKYQIKEEMNGQYLQEIESEKEKRLMIENQFSLLQQDKLEVTNRYDELQQAFQTEVSQYQQEINQLKAELQLQLDEKNNHLSHEPVGEPVDEDESAEKKKKNDEEMVPKSEVENYLLEIDEYKDKLFESEKRCRKLHNKLQELKGNVRVFVRCRPFLSSDNDCSHDVSCVNCNADGTTISLTEHCVRGTGQVYQFDQVYNLKKSQYDVFKDVSDFIQSTLDGYRVCVFSYGQTGSGKVMFLLLFSHLTPHTSLTSQL